MGYIARSYPYWKVNGNQFFVRPDIPVSIKKFHVNGDCLSEDNLLRYSPA